MQNFIWFILSGLLGCIGNELTGRYRGEVQYLCRNERLITPKGSGVQDVEILYKKQPIETLSVAKMLIINNSQKELTKKDLYRGGLQIKATGKGKILRVDFLESTDSSNIYQADIDNNGKIAYIKFHHINPGNAWLFQIFHTGQSGKELACECNATGITKTRKIMIIGKNIGELLLLLPFQIFCYAFLLAIGLIMCEKSGGLHWLFIFPLLLIVALVFSYVLTWELPERFTGWYKLARKNGF